MHPLALIPWIQSPDNFKTQKRNKSSYLVGIRKTNICTDIASWRWCQFRNANARPARIRPPKWWELNDSVVTKAWVLGLVHSNTERKRYIDLKGIWGSRPKFEQGPISNSLTYWASDYLLIWVPQTFLPGIEVSSRWRRREQKLHRFQWWQIVIKHMLKWTSSQTWEKEKIRLWEQFSLLETSRQL